ncbi:MAG: metallophosphoesterase [Nanoarchaeota archaeon]|nr:metallophosphoesterase [Nanoarchaeota archaeon]
MENPDRKQRKSKILAVGDIHGDTRFTERLAETAKRENVDLVLLAGDLLISDEHFEGVIGPFARAGKQVLLVPGNHEAFATIDFLAELYSNAKNIHGGYFISSDLGVFGVGGAGLSGLDPLTESGIFYLLKRGHEKIKHAKRKIMLTHMHPGGSRSEFSGFPGSSAIRKAIEYFQPDFAINSHIHEASGIEEKIGKTRVINVSGKEKLFEI